MATNHHTIDAAFHAAILSAVYTTYNKPFLSTIPPALEITFYATIDTTCIDALMPAIN